jgi:hypothetical protein
MPLIRSDVIDSAKVMLGIVPWKELSEVLCAITAIQEPCRILGGGFNFKKCKFRKWIVIEGSGAHKQPGHPMGIKDTLWRLGSHLTASIVNDLRMLILNQIQYVLRKQSYFKNPPSLLSRLIPADHPAYGLSGIFIQQQVKVKL